MATFKVTKNGTELPAKVGNVIFNTLLCQSPTEKNFSDAAIVKTMLTDGMDAVKCKKAGIPVGKESDVYECKADDTVIFKVTRKELIAYCDAVGSCKVSFDALNKQWRIARPVDKDGKDAFPYKVGEMPKAESKGNGNKSVEMIA